MIGSRQIVFLSIMTTAFLASKVLSFGMSEPIYVFLGALFSYYAGNACLCYIYFLCTLNIALNVTLFLELGTTFKQLLIVSVPESSLFVVCSIPNIYFTFLLIGYVYLIITVAIFSSRTVIKKLGIIKRLGYLHA